MGLPKNLRLYSLVTLVTITAGSLLRVGVTYESVEDCRLVSNDPTVMSWWNVGYISWTEFDFLAIVRSHTHPT